MNDVSTETRQQRLEEAEAQVQRCYEQMLEHADKPSRYVRSESFRLAVMYRNSLMTTEQLAEIERARGLC
jgi:hypothetical protein